MNKPTACLAAAALCTATTLTAAQVLPDYRCTIRGLEAPGFLEEKPLEYWRRLYIGKEFTVERRTGMMAGPLKNSFITKPVVIDSGSTQNSFKVVTTMRSDQGAGVGSNIYVLVVKEFDSAPAKPFLFFENDQVFFGTCVHF
jgi:hypothetical protein